jgi:hypothetical protein
MQYRPGTQIGGKAAEKAVTKADKMFKSMIRGVPGMSAMTDLLGTLGESLGFMAPLEAIFKVINGLFKVMGAQILPVIMVALRPLLDILMSMKPIFVLIGSIIAVLIEIALIPFTIALELFMAVLEPFLPLFEALIPVFKAISPLIKVLASVLSAILAPAIKAVGTVVLAIARAIAFVINSFINLVNLIPGVNLPRIPKFQKGTDFVPRTGPAIVHKGEQILSAGQRGDMINALEENNRLTKQLIDEQRRTREANERGRVFG